jgi:hypothetical protein
VHNLDNSPLDVLRGKARRPVDIKTGTLVFVYALRHKEACNAGG